MNVITPGTAAEKRNPEMQNLDICLGILYIPPQSGGRRTKCVQLSLAE